MRESIAQKTLTLVSEMHASVARLQADGANTRDRIKAVEDALDKDRRAFSDRLAQLSAADSELKKELSVFLAQQGSSNSGEWRKETEKRLDALEVRNAKQDGGAQVAGWIWGALGTTFLAFIGMIIYSLARA